MFKFSSSFTCMKLVELINSSSFIRLKPVKQNNMRQNNGCNVLLDDDMTAHVGDFGLARVYGWSAFHTWRYIQLWCITAGDVTDSKFEDDLSIYNFVLIALPNHVMDIIDPSMLFKEENDEERSPNHKEEKAIITDNDPQGGIQSREIEEHLVSVMRIGLACSTTSPRERMPMKDIQKNLYAIRDSFHRSSNRNRRRLRKKPGKLLTPNVIRVIAAVTLALLLLCSSDDLNIYNFVLMALPDHVMDIIDPSMLFSEEVNDREISPDHIEERAVITYNDPNVSIQSLEIEEYLVSVMRIGLACSTTFPRERMAMKDVLKNLNPNLSFNELDGEVSKEGILANATAISLIGNDKLCGGVSELLLPVCSRKKPGKLLTPNVIRVVAAVTFALLLLCSFSIYLIVKKSRRHSTALSSNGQLQPFDLTIIAIQWMSVNKKLALPDLIYRQKKLAQLPTTSEKSKKYMSGQVSILGDIYSYGVLLLEMFTGKRPTDRKFEDDLSIYNFVLMTLPNHVMDIIDPSMLFEEENDPQGGIQSREIEEHLVSVMRIGLACSTTSPRERMPMKDILKNLYAIRDSFLRSSNRNRRRLR
ncbi:hypothetical protein EZV62_016612 [Acer yangbiense]|uniref:Protein kinase domain-containing protein n=1 Tax=Acer yangbiense TaxID=1000413 RepID=A0A5C7HNY9_9ROSI|nr:hypothetical protein EZV62_016612 [Acer yangbiense]